MYMLRKYVRGMSFYRASLTFRTSTFPLVKSMRSNKAYSSLQLFYVSGKKRQKLNSIDWKVAWVDRSPCVHS